jgi:hypothetical protein
MQVSATLIAAQQAAREARARLQMPQAGPQLAAGPNFASALEKTSGVSGGFSTLPLKQVVAPASPTAQPQTATPPRMGMHIDITV